MLDDPFAGLFERGFEIDSTGGEHEKNARALADRGLIRTEEVRYVRCWYPLDSDGHTAHACAGRVYLNELDDEYECPDCGRELHASMKHRFSAIRLVPDLAAMRRFLLGRLAATFARVEERPAGVFRIPTATDDILVLLMDALAEQARAPSICHCGCHQRVMRVTGRRPFGACHVATAPAYRLAEIALGVAESSFLRAIRGLANQTIAAPAPFGPALVAYPGERMTLTVARKTEPTSLQAPRGSRWSEVTLYLVDGETMAARANGGRLQRFHHYEVGMSDGRTGRPNKKWRLLEGLCENFGELRWRGYAASFGAFKEQVSGHAHALSRRQPKTI